MSLFKRQSLVTLPQLPLFSQLSDEMNRFFERDRGFQDTSANLLGGQWVPNIDIETTDKSYIIRADVPGVDAKEINVSMENGVLTIEGKRESKVEENRENYRCIERNYGAFYRTIALPESVESEKIKAHNRNGVLEITVPKTKSSKQKSIPIFTD